MRVRPPTDPVAHLPRRRPRHVKPHWIDRINLIIGATLTTSAILAATIGHHP